MRKLLGAVLLALALFTSLAFAQDNTDIGFRGWGPRLGADRKPLPFGSLGTKVGPSHGSAAFMSRRYAVLVSLSSANDFGSGPGLCPGRRAPSGATRA